MDIPVIGNIESWLIILFLTLMFTLTVLVLYYKLDEFDPEPKSQVFMAFIYGVFAPVITLPIYYAFVEVLLFIYSADVIKFLSIVLFAPIVEELVKAYLLLRIIKKFNIDGPMDGLIYGIALGAGFSTIENLVFGASALLEKGFADALRLTLLRGGFAFIGHPIYSGIFGWGVGASKVGLNYSEWSQIYTSILLHMAWNAMFTIRLFYPVSTALQGLVVLMVIIITAYQMYKRVVIARKIEIKLDEEGYYRNRERIGYRVR